MKWVKWFKACVAHLAHLARGQERGGGELTEAVNRWEDACLAALVRGMAEADVRAMLAEARGVRVPDRDLPTAPTAPDA